MARRLATFLAATPFAHALGNGQQSLFVLLALTLAWRSRARRPAGCSWRWAR